MFVLALATKTNHPTYKEIETIIDRSDPLIERLIGLFGCKKESLRYLRGKGPDLIGSVWLDNPRELLFAVDIAPAGRRPTDRREWKIFRSFWIGSDLDSNLCYGPLRGGFSQLPETFELLIFRGLCQLGYEAGWKKVNKLLHEDFERIHDIHDYFGFVANWCDCLAMRYPNPAGTDQLPLALLKRYSLAAIICQSERWHQQLNHEELDIRDLPTEPSNLSDWPPLLPQGFDVNQHQLISLISADQLSEEGFRLEHCVGGYSDACLLGDSHIVSVRNAAGDSLSTVEITLVQGSDQIWFPEVVQHRARNNEAPSKASKVALAGALEHLRTPLMQEHLGVLQAFHQDRRTQFSELLWSRGARFSLEVMSDVMNKILPDYDSAMIWVSSYLSGCRPSDSQQLNPVRQGAGQ